MIKKVELTPYGFFPDEEYDRIIPDLSGYGILSGGSHIFRIGDTICEDGIYNSFWCYCSWWDECCDCNYEKYEKEEIRLYVDMIVPDIFYDWDHGSDLGCVKIYVNDKYAGFYCPRYFLFYLSDWTHDNECVSVAKKIIPQLFDIVKKKYNYGPRQEKYIICCPEWTVSIGADPEFEELEIPSEYSPTSTSISGNENSEIGRDGQGDQIELRPEPAKNPALLVRNIKKLINRINVPLSVKGDGFPLGAHIHFSLPEKMRRKPYIMHLCTILDDFLGKKLIDFSGKARGNYKRLSAYESKPWGFEYRSLPSAYLLNPKIAYIVFKIAKNVVQRTVQYGSLEYNDPPANEDYIKIAGLNEKEYEIFENFIREYSNYRGEAINANWGKPVKPELKIIFNDDWTTEAMSLFERFLKGSDLLEEKQVYRIRLYGLKKERGKVIAGFSCEGYETIEHQISADDFTFGIPWEVRMYPDEKEIRKIVNAILKKIERGE